MSRFTKSWDKNSIIDDVYNSCIEWVTLDSVDLEDGRVQLTLPRLKLIQDAISQHKVVHAKIARPAKTTISMWLEVYKHESNPITDVLLHVCVHGNIFRAYFKDEEYHALDYDKEVEMIFADMKVVGVHPEGGYNDFGQDKIGWKLEDPVDLTKFYGK